MRLWRHLVFLLLLSLAAAAQERILSYDSQITVQSDARVLVSETITVWAESNKIRHGIYRDFPTRYRDTYGMMHRVGFEPLGVTRDGFPEPYTVSDISNGVRVYFGDAKRYLQVGEHTYVFNYSTDRQIGYFLDRDELYWNVTGDGWAFPIEAVSATVILPDNVRHFVRETTAYTGAQGERGQNYTVARDDFDHPVFRSQSLSPAQGLTIVVTFPKGYIAAPTSEQKLSWFMEDNRSTLVGFSGALLVFLYYFLVWLRVGRDPEPGSIVPLYEPPDGLSPASMRYLERMGFDDKAFTACILDLAAKGYLTIQQGALEYVLVRKHDHETARTKLAPDEEMTARKLFSSDSCIALSRLNFTTLNQARKDLELSLNTSMEKIYFLTNSRFMWPGIALTIAALAWLVWESANFSAYVGLFLTVWLTFWTFGVAGILAAVYKAWKSALKGGVAGVVSGMGALFLSLFALPFLAGECFGIWMLFAASAVPVFISAVTMLGLNFLFHFLLKAPTRAGRRLMDRVEGFKMFLSAVEGDRMNVMTSTSDTPELFERFLPYALALGVENGWAQKFSRVMAQGVGGAAPTDVAYSPSWYTGVGLSSFSASQFTSSFAASFSVAVSSSSAPASSSGSGGGGSSGGGGGGGGGGGW